IRSTVMIWPPAPSRSTSTVRSPCRAAVTAALSPATPAPMTAMSKSLMRSACRSAPFVDGNRRAIARAVDLPVAVALATGDDDVHVPRLEDADELVLARLELGRQRLLAEGCARVDVVL